MNIKLTIILAFIITSLSLSAQKMELGLMGGLSIYSGDLSPKEFGLYFKDIRLAYGVFGRYTPGSKISLRFAYERANLAADDNNSVIPAIKNRGYIFKTKLNEFSFLLEWNVFTLGRTNGVKFTPYLFAGGAYYTFNPQGKLDNDWIDLQPLGTEGQGLSGYTAPYDLAQFAIPAGGGFKLDLDKNVVLGFEFGGRKLFTDYLDDVTSNGPISYFDVRDGNGEVAAHFSYPAAKGDEDLSYRRGGKYNDWYFIGNVTLSVRIGDRSGIFGGGRGQGIGCPGAQF